jgi:hypothetical protein
MSKQYFIQVQQKKGTAMLNDGTSRKVRVQGVKHTRKSAWKVVFNALKHVSNLRSKVDAKSSSHLGRDVLKVVFISLNIYVAVQHPTPENIARLIGSIVTSLPH